MEHLQEALGLLCIGMLTVFAILIIVIELGKGLIALVNKFAPEEQTKKAAVPQTATVDAQTRSIIAAAVDQLTGGKGRVAKVTKI